MKKPIKRMKDHYIICGCGDIGREVALEFKRSNIKFLIIDLDPEQSELARDESILFVKGSAIDDEVLMEANIEQAKGLISVLPDDESNVFVVLTAHQLNLHLAIISKAVKEQTTQKLLRAGASRVISPYQIAGCRIASIVLRPSVVNFLDVVVEGRGMPMRIEEVKVNTGSPLIDKTIRESGIGQYTGAIVVGISEPSGRTRVNPSAKTSLASIKLNEKDVLVAIGSEDQLKRLKDFVKHGK